jgi:hypothetical protein
LNGALIRPIVCGVWKFGLTLTYAAVATVMVQPLLNFRELGSSSYEGDARFIIWTLAWNNHAVLQGLPLFDANTFFPAERALAYTDHLFGVSLFSLPIYAATGNPVLAYNVVWFLSFVLCGLAMHVLAFRLTRSHLGGLAAGLIYTYSFYRMHHAPGHLGLIWMWPLPLSIWLLTHWVERPTTWRALAWTLAVVVQALASWYLAVLALLANAGILVWLHITERRTEWPRRILHLAVASAIAVIGVLPFALPYSALPPVPLQQIAALSADVPAYLVPPENTWAGKLWMAHIGSGPRSIWGEQTLFLGYVALALGLVGCAAAIARGEWRRYGGYVLLAAAGLWLSFGPSVVRGQEQWSLYGAISWWPGFSGFRAPARYAVLVVLSLSVLGAAGAAALQRRFGPKGTVAVVALLPIMLSEWFILDFPAGKPQRFRTPAIYALPAVQQARALVSLPDYRGTPDWYLGADYLLFSTTHWRRIVNGYGRAEPPGHPRIISHMNAFPGPNNARTMRAIGVEYVVVHSARYRDGALTLLDVAMASPEYELVEKLGTDYLFRVKPGP